MISIFIMLVCVFFNMHINIYFIDKITKNIHFILSDANLHGIMESGVIGDKGVI